MRQALMPCCVEIAEKMSKPHFDVVIATPGHSMDAEYVKSLMATCQLLSSRGISFTYQSEYSSFVPLAREATAMGERRLSYDKTEIAGGKFTYGKLFWIDSDIVWSPADFLALYESEADIISGLYVLDNNRTLPVQPIGAMRQLDRSEVMFRNEYIEVGAVGFGFLCVKSGVFESMPRPWFKLARSSMGDVGEDYSWCHAARNLGHKIYVDSKVTVAHRKVMNLTV